MVDDKYRSGLERRIASQLESAGMPFKYEDEVARIPYFPKPKKKRYTPDMWLPNGIIIEAKGRFRSSNRVKLKSVAHRYPDLDIRLVFSRASNTLGKRSDTTYGEWCDRHGFPWADDGTIPPEWIQEPKEEDRIQAIRRIQWRWREREYSPDADIPESLE